MAAVLIGRVAGRVQDRTGILRALAVIPDVIQDPRGHNRVGRDTPVGDVCRIAAA
jgi:hypothetical protein